MSGHRSFAELRKKMTPERRARNAAATRETLQQIERQELALHELRQARRRSQEDLARELKVQQPAIAKLERRADMYVSNLRRYIEALGGTLEITARFPDATVKIANFSDMGTAGPTEVVGPEPEDPSAGRHPGDP